MLLNADDLTKYLQSHFQFENSCKIYGVFTIDDIVHDKLYIDTDYVYNVLYGSFELGKESNQYLFPDLNIHEAIIGTIYVILISGDVIQYHIYVSNISFRKLSTILVYATKFMDHLDDIKSSICEEKNYV